jgi:hypothetical protein
MYKNRVTQSVVAGLTTLISAASWLGLKNVLTGGHNWLWPSIGFLILLTFLSLNWLLTKSKAILLVTLTLVSISFFFAFSFKMTYLAVLFIALLFFLFGSWRAVNEKEVRIKLEVDKILRRGLPAVLTGLILITATAYYFSPLALENQNQIKIPRFLFDLIVQPVVETLEAQVPLSQLSAELGVGSTDNQQFEEALYQLVNERFNQFSQPYQEYLPFGLAIGLFFALKAISLPFKWLVILLSWLIFKLLVSLGAIKIQEKGVLQQVIEI